jgi:hypothetical protein
MRRDRELVSRILLAIEALPPGGPHVLQLANENQQDVLDHLDLLEQQKLIKALVHRAGGKVDRVAVHGLAPAGHDFLEAERRQADQPPFNAGFKGGITSGPSGFAQAPAAPLGLNGTTGPNESIGARGLPPIVQPPANPPLQVNLEANTSVLSAGTASFSITGNDADLSVTSSSRKLTIARTVLANRSAIEISAFSLLAGLDARIEQIKEQRLNSEPLGELEDLRALVLQFLNALSAKSDEPIADATISIKDGLKRWWTKDHDSICGKTLNMALFAGGLSICALGGVLVPATALTVGVLIGGSTVVSAIKTYGDTLSKTTD